MLVEPFYGEGELKDSVMGYIVDCPGCKMPHALDILQPNNMGAMWTFNGNLECPTFHPSLLVRFRYGMPGKQDEVCHSFIRDGKWQFLSDCTHELAGQIVPMIDIT